MIPRDKLVANLLIPKIWDLKFKDKISRLITNKSILTYSIFFFNKLIEFVIT